MVGSGCLSHAKAWQQSNVKVVAEREGEIIGFVRGMTDSTVTMYIAEILGTV